MAIWEPLRPQDTSAPTLSRITGGAVSRRNCPGSEVSRLFVDPVPKDLKTLVPMCLVAEVSANRPYTALAHEAPWSNEAIGSTEDKEIHNALYSSLATSHDVLVEVADDGPVVGEALSRLQTDLRRSAWDNRKS